MSFSDEEIKEINANYWEEENELKMGIHPIQIKERIEKCLSEQDVAYIKITFLDWNVDGPRVRVSLDGTVYGVFNYETNHFE